MLPDLDPIEVIDGLSLIYIDDSGRLEDVSDPEIDVDDPALVNWIYYDSEPEDQPVEFPVKEGKHVRFAEQTPSDDEQSDLFSERGKGSSSPAQVEDAVPRSDTDDDSEGEEGGIVEALDDANNEFESWTQYPHLKLSEEGGADDTVIRPGDYALIKGQQRGVVEEWIGEVLDIRGETPSAIYIKLRWFYTLRDFRDRLTREKKKGKALENTKFIGRNEMILTDDVEIHTAETCIGKAPIVRYEESNLMQADIPEGALYWRWLFRWNRKRQPSDPELAKLNCCGNPAKPDTDVLHYCPMHGCRMWLHERCLKKRHATNEAISDMYLSTAEWDLETEILPYLGGQADNGEPAVGDPRPPEAPMLIFDPLPVVRAIAAQPILRGAKSGNAKAVLTARRIFYEEQLGLRTLDEPDWQFEIGVSVLQDLVKAQRSSGVRTSYYRCARCGKDDNGAI